nr:hypothetical protein [Deltaproteobacteria bacterium]
MNDAFANTVYCPECGTQNAEDMARCISCDHLLDPLAAAESRTAPPRAVHPQTLGMMAGIVVVMLLAMTAAGLSFSMKVLPAPISLEDSARTLQQLVSDDEIDGREAASIMVSLRSAETARAMVDSSTGFRTEEQVAAEKRMRPVDQSMVLGFGSVMGFVFPLLAFGLAALFVAAVQRPRRVREIVLGAAAGVVVQLLIWLIQADFSVSAIFSGELVMLASNLGFAGSPIMLVGMTLVLGVATSAVLGLATWFALEELTGVAGCAHCGHRFSVRPHAPSECAKCKVPLSLGRRVRYRQGDAFLRELGTAHDPVTRASSGASELLCLACAKTYEADACPVHPHEPLVDPTRDEVKYQLLDLDAKGGTSRYAKWTAVGLGVDEGVVAPTPTGPLLCMACAKTYDTETCPLHPHEPLLDPSTEAVRLELIDADDRARSKMGTMLILGATGIAVLLTALVATAIDLDAGVVFIIFATLVSGLVAVASVLTPKLAPPRYLRWTGESEVDLDEFGLGAQATFLDPAREFLQMAKKRLAVMLGATAVGAGIGAGVAVAADWSVPALAVLGGLVALIGASVVLWVADTARGVKKVAADAKQ